MPPTMIRLLFLSIMVVGKAQDSLFVHAEGLPKSRIRRRLRHSSGKGKGYGPKKSPPQPGPAPAPQPVPVPAPVNGPTPAVRGGAIVGDVIVGQPIPAPGVPVVGTPPSEPQGGDRGTGVGGVVVGTPTSPTNPPAPTNPPTLTASFPTVAPVGGGDDRDGPTVGGTVGVGAPTTGPTLGTPTTGPTIGTPSAGPPTKIPIAPPVGGGGDQGPTAGAPTTGPTAGTPTNGPTIGTPSAGPPTKIPIAPPVGGGDDRDGPTIGSPVGVEAPTTGPTVGTPSAGPPTKIPIAPPVGGGDQEGPTAGAPTTGPTIGTPSAGPPTKIPIASPVGGGDDRDGPTVGGPVGVGIPTAGPPTKIPIAPPVGGGDRDGSPGGQPIPTGDEVLTPGSGRDRLYDASRNEDRNTALETASGILFASGRTVSNAGVVELVPCIDWESPILDAAKANVEDSDLHCRTSNTCHLGACRVIEERFFRCDKSNLFLDKPAVCSANTFDHNDLTPIEPPETVDPDASGTGVDKDSTGGGGGGAIDVDQNSDICDPKYHGNKWGLIPDDLSVVPDDLNPGECTSSEHCGGRDHICCMNRLCLCGTYSDYETDCRP